MSEGKASVIDQQKALMLYHYILKSGIPFGYHQANCHNISHYICLLFQSLGINSAKIWAFTPAVYSMSNSSLISFADRNKLSPTGKIDWGYHVAPIVQVKHGSKTKKMVIDPTLFPNGPVHYRTWLAKLKTQRLIYLIMDPEWYLFNSSLLPNPQQQFLNETENIKPNLTFPDWFSNKLITDFFKYEEDSQNNHWMEKGLAVNATASKFYRREIEPILKNFSQRPLLNDYRNLVGNVFNFETVFRDNMLNYEMDEPFQNKHQKVIEKYRKTYEKELTKWQGKVTELSSVSFLNIDENTTAFSSSFLLSETPQNQQFLS